MRGLLISLGITALASCTSVYAGGFAVKTQNGIITGHVGPNVSNVIEFLGVPYAQPPVDSLRFRAPLAYHNNEDYNASTWGFDCPQTPSKPVDYPGFTTQAQQIINYFAAGAGTSQSDDCLTLNIWTKSLSDGRNSTKRPVLIFFHGGRFAIGNAHSPFYDGQRLANATDAVVVTLTYRLNIFGFPGAPNTTHNLGLRDQRLAVEWVRDNIAGFGGDASKLTIFGQSAGGVATDWWTFAYEGDPIVHGIISESGNAFSFPVNTIATQESNWYNVSATLGCGSSGDTLACMQKQNTSAILAAVAKLPSVSGGNPVRSTPPFYPSVDNEVVLANYSDLLDAGQFAKIPQLLGNNNHEQGYYVIPAYAKGINVTTAEGDAFLLESFTCPNNLEARTRSSTFDIPVWQYRYFGDWPNIRLYPTSGAYHGTELEMIFGNSGAVSGIAPSEAEERLTAVMQHAWFAFADDPKTGLTRYGWPRFNSTEDSLIRLGYNNSPVPEFVAPGLYSSTCGNVTLGSDSP